MHRKVLSNLFILIFLNILVKPFWILGIDRAVQNSVGTAQYGDYANLFAFSMLFIMLLDFGINNFSSTSVAKDHSIINHQFSSLVPLKIIFSLAYFLLTIFAGFIYGFSIREIFFLSMLAFNQVLAFFILYFRSNISGLQLFRTDAFLSVSDRSMMIIFTSILIWSGFANISIESFIYAQTLGYVCSVVICFLVLKPYLKEIKFTFNKNILKELIIKAYPFALLAFIMTFYSRLDVILLKKIHQSGDVENGIYARANRLLEASNMLAAMVSTMLLSLFANLISQKADIDKTVKVAMSILIAPAIMLSVFSFIFKNKIMNLLYFNSTIYEANVFGIAILNFIPICIIYIFGTLLTANHNLKILNRSALFALVVNAILNILLIPKYGALSAACVALITNSIVAVLNIIYVRKILKLNFTIKVLFNYLFFILSFFIFSWLIYKGDFMLFVSTVLCFVFGIIGVFVLRIINIRSVKAVITGFNK